MGIEVYVRSKDTIYIVKQIIQRAYTRQHTRSANWSYIWRHYALCHDNQPLADTVTMEDAMLPRQLTFRRV
jgi:hypothetical protein